MFRALKITDVNVETCADDIGNAGVFLKDFAEDVKLLHIDAAAADLSSSISSLSTAVSECNIPEVTTKLDALAAAIKWANVSKIDKVSKIIVSASDLWQDIVVVANAVDQKDTDKIGSSIGKLLSDWTSISGGCQPGSQACKFVDGLLRVMQVVATDIQPCEQALMPVYINITNAMAAFKNKDYEIAIEELANALDKFANALTTDSCGMGPLTAVLQKVAPKLATAIVKIDSSHSTQIIVGSLDVYDKLYKAMEDLQSGNVADFGMQMGTLLQMLRSSNCNTEVCTVLSGLLASLQLEAQDFDACADKLDSSWEALAAAVSTLERGDWSNGIDGLGNALARLSSAVSSCDIPKLGKILEDTATKLGLNGVAKDIGQVVSVLVDGSDITLSLSKAVSDFNSKSWGTFGQDLGNLATEISNTKCQSFVCKVLEGVLNGAAIPFEHLEQCETNLKSAENSFIAGSNYFRQRNYKTGITYYAAGMNEISKAVSDCGLTQELNYMQQESNVLHLAKSTKFGRIATVLVHGSDFYSELYSTVQAIETHDYRTAGTEMQKVLNQMSQWTRGHACTSDACYVIMGIFQYFGDIQGTIKTCENDFSNAFHNFSAAIAEFTHNGKFSTDKHRIINGLRDIGLGMKAVSRGVSDCDLADLAKIIDELAIKLGIAPEIQFIDDALKIIIEGAEIEQELGNAFVDFSEHDWPGFGYNVIKLIKTLL